MKKIIAVLWCLLCASAYADNVITSKDYVDTAVGNLQTQIGANDANTVLTYTSTAGTVGKKTIYDSTATFGAQTDSLVTAGAFNTAIQNALETEFVCIEWLGDIHDNAHCSLYQIRATTPKQILPSGYTQLEYIESTGTQYIDTGILLKYDTDTGYWKTKISFSENFHQIGADYNAILDGQNGILRTIGSNGPAYSLDTVYDFIVGLNTNHKRYLTIGGTTYTGSAAGRNNNILIFSLGGLDSQGAKVRIKAKVYNFSIVKNDALVRNLIPARRDSDNALGMYDTVSGTFFTNAGTGEFIAGPVVSSNLYLPSGN